MQPIYQFSSRISAKVRKFFYIFILIKSIYMAYHRLVQYQRKFVRHTTPRTQMKIDFLSLLNGKINMICDTQQMRDVLYRPQWVKRSSFIIYSIILCCYFFNPPGRRYILFSKQLTFLMVTYWSLGYCQADRRHVFLLVAWLRKHVKSMFHYISLNVLDTDLLKDILHSTKKQGYHGRMY